MLKTCLHAAIILLLGTVTDAWMLRAQTPKTSYDEHISPVFREHCFGCHNPDKSKGGLVLDNYTQLMAGGSSGAVVEPGDADASRLFLLVSRQERPYMPPGREGIEAAQVELVRRWIEGGALENAKSKAKLSKKPTLDMTVGADAAVKPDGPPPMPRGQRLAPAVHTTRSSAITALAASPWAPLVAVAGQRQVLLYHTGSFELLGVLPFAEGTPQALRFSRNGALLLAGGGRAAKSGRVVVWDVISGARVLEVGEEYDAVLAADISVDHSQVALGGPSRVVRVFDTSTGEVLYEIKKHTDWITAVEYSPDGVLLATADRTGGLHLWEAETGRPYLTLGGHGAAVTAVSWRADSNVVASASEDGTVRLWEAERGAQVKRWNAHGGGSLTVSFARDGRLVTVGRDRQAKLWDQNGKALRSVGGFTDLTLEGVFQHDGARMVIGDWTGAVRVFSVADGKAIGTLEANPPTLESRLAAAKVELDRQTKERSRLLAVVEKAEKETRAIEAELTVHRQTLKTATGSIATGAVELTQNGTALREGTVALTKAVEDLAGKIGFLSETEVTAESGDKDGLLGTAQKATLERAVQTVARLKEWIAMQEDLKEARRTTASVQSKLGGLTQQLGVSKKAGDEARKALPGVEPLYVAARQNLARWEAASDLEGALKALEESQQRAQEVESVRSGLETSLQQAVVRVEAAQKEAERVGTRLEEAASEAEQAGAAVKDVSEQVRAIRKRLDEASPTPDAGPGS